MPSHPDMTALVVAAHPDDGDFGCAGWVSHHAALGWDVHFLICTNGAKGTEDRAMTRERLIALRHEEQREACRRLGARGVTFLDHEDSELVYDRALLEEIVRCIRTVRPHTVLTHDPTDIIILDSFINHPDHRAAGHGHARCRLSHGPGPPELPGPPRRRARTAQGPRSAALEFEPPELGFRYQRARRTEDRGAHGARDAVPRPRRLRRLFARTVARGGWTVPGALPEDRASNT